MFLRFEDVPSKLCVDPEAVAEDLKTDPTVLVKARMEAHYFTHGSFMAKENAVIHDADIFAKHKLPGMIVRGLSA